MKYGLYSTLILLPQISFAQTTGSLQGLITGSLEFISDVLIPFVLGIAFLIFVVNAIRFFVIGGSSSEGKENSKSLAIYSIAAFVFILAFWGIINIIANGIGLADDPCIPGSDYVTDRYGVRSGTSCPPPAGNVLIPPNQPVMPISPPDPRIILPGTDAPPNTSIPQTQFTPDGDPIDQTPNDYTPIRSFADTVRTQANSYLNSELPIYLGNNAAAVASAMFADLGGAHQTSIMGDYNRTVAMIHLENAGVLTPNTALSYAALLTNYYDEAYGQPPLDFAQAVIDSTKAVPTPATVTTNSNRTKQSIIDGLVMYNFTAPAPLSNAQISTIIDTFYNTTTDPDARWDSFLGYYMNINFDNQNKTILNQYRNDLNAEKMLSVNADRYIFIEPVN